MPEKLTMREANAETDRVVKRAAAEFAKALTGPEAQRQLGQFRRRMVEAQIAYASAVADLGASLRASRRGKS